MKLRELLAIAALGMLVGAAYVYIQQSDEEAADREREFVSATIDR